MLPFFASTGQSACAWSRTLAHNSSSHGDARPCEHSSTLLQGHLFRAAFLRQVPLFMRNLVENVALCLLNAGLESTARRWLAFIELKWRDVLTKRIHRPYFENMVRLRGQFKQIKRACHVATGAMLGLQLELCSTKGPTLLSVGSEALHKPTCGIKAPL